jgi:hypothetical protein
MNTKPLGRIAFATVALSLTLGGAASAQLGRQQNLVEPNVAADSMLARLPGMTAATVEALRGARPILSITALDSILDAQSIARPQRAFLYSRMFVHVDLNRGTDAEIMMVPGMTTATQNAIKAGRPWANLETFRTALGNVSAAEVARLEQYFFIPIDLNRFTNGIMDTFASIGVGTSQWKREFGEYRPWTSMAQFDREIGKYLRGRPEELQRLKRYVIINP